MLWREKGISRGKGENGTEIGKRILKCVSNNLF